MKALQFFSEEYLQQCQKLTPEDVIAFLDDFSKMHLESKSEDKSILISIKIPESLLHLFRQKAELNRLKYQTQIKKLMRDWISVS